MKLLITRFALWLESVAYRLRERFDVCHYPGCTYGADSWCITGGHRHCVDHNSDFYSDVEMCQVCYEQMTPEEIAREIAEAEASEDELEAL